MNKVQLCIGLAVLFLLSACASRQENNLEEIFVTEIREDNSKMFAFTLRQEKSSSGEQPRHKAMAKKAGKKRRNGAGKGAGKEEVRERKNPLADIFQQRLELRLSKSDYCRTGYLELERYTNRGAMTMRGECNESATEKDRQRFPNRTNVGG